MKLSYLQQIKNIVKEGKRDDVLCILSEQNIALKKENIQLDRKISNIQHKAKEFDIREERLAERERLNKLDHEKITEQANRLNKQQLAFCKDAANIFAPIAYKYFDLCMQSSVYNRMPNRDYSYTFKTGDCVYHIYKDRITVDTIRDVEVIVHWRESK